MCNVHIKLFPEALVSVVTLNPDLLTLQAIAAYNKQAVPASAELEATQNNVFVLKPVLKKLLSSYR